MAPSITDLSLLGERLRQGYELFEDEAFWKEVSRRLPAGTPSPDRPGLDTLTKEEKTVRRHLDLAMEKSQRNPRLALVGPFSVGKSAMLNAILHSKAFNDLLKEQLDYAGTLLPEGAQVTTGNITELEFTGVPPTGEKPAFHFEAQFLSEDELQALIQYFNDEMKLNLPASLLQGKDWLKNLQEKGPAYLEHKYAIDSLDKTRRNLIILREIIASLPRAKFRNPGDGPENLGPGKAGLEKFLNLLQRPALPQALPSSLASIKPYIGEFHFVKFLRLRLPHPDFPSSRFSLFDFPGLGAGYHRDEFISMEFLADTNVILLMFRPDMVGGEVVQHILGTFTRVRGQLSADHILERIYFLQNGGKTNPIAPRGDTQIEFYRDFLQAVKNHLTPVLNAARVPETQWPTYLENYLDHFLACDARLGKDIRSETRDFGAATNIEAYRKRCETGFYDCPTDPETLRTISQHPELNDPARGFPMLAQRIADPVIAKRLAEVFAPMKHQAGIIPLLNRIKDFVGSDGPRFLAEDVDAHLRAAVAPLAPLRAFSVADEPKGSSFAFRAGMDHFGPAVDFENDWAKILDAWATGDPSGIRSRKNLVDAAQKLADVELRMVEEIQAKARTLVSKSAWDLFRQELTLLPEGGLGRWLQDKDGDAEKVTPGRIVIVRPGARKKQEPMLRLEHPLIFFRFFLKQRQEMLTYFCSDLPNRFVTELTKVYKSSGGTHWEPFNQLWQRVVGWVENRQEPLDQEVKSFCQSNPWAKEFFTSWLKTVEAPDWDLRTLVCSELVTPEAKESGGGRLFDRDINPINPVRITEWVPSDDMPGTSQQLSVLLTRLVLMPIREEALTAFKTEALPEMTKERILRCLKGVGFIAANTLETDLKWADPSVDFWKVPLPRLAGKRLVDGKLLWNPVPFNIFGDRFRQPFFATQLLDSSADYLALVFSDIFSRLARGTKSRWLNQVQSQLLDVLKSVSPTNPEADEIFPLWRWLKEYSHLIMEVPPLQGKLQQLQDTLHSLQAHNLFR